MTNEEILRVAAKESIARVRTRATAIGRPYKKSVLRHDLAFAEGVVASLALVEGRIREIGDWDPCDPLLIEIDKLAKEI